MKSKEDKTTRVELQNTVQQSLENYFTDLEGETPTGIYDMVLNLVEKPMLEVVMKQAKYNQSKAATWLGLNRNTLHKKLQHHQLLDYDAD